MESKALRDFIINKSTILLNKSEVNDSDKVAILTVLKDLYALDTVNSFKEVL